MIKKFVAAVVACGAVAPAANAGPYLNWESNASFTGNTYNSALHELHIGWEGSNGPTSYYIQGGPAASNVSGASTTDIEFSGKAGGAVAVSEKVSVYGELSMITAATNGYGGKAGVKYTF